MLWFMDIFSTVVYALQKKTCVTHDSAVIIALSVATLQCSSILALVVSSRSFEYSDHKSSSKPTNKHKGHP